MEVHIEQSWHSGAYEVWLYSRLHDGKYLYVKPIGPDGWQDEILNEGQTPPGPTLTLPKLWMDALVKAVSKLPTSDEATAVHLKDAREVRDRLLRVVEHKMGVS